MALSDGPRQLVAGFCASALFLALFFAAQMVWWLAGALAVAVYGATLLLIRRKSPLDEVQLTARVTAADIAVAADALQIAGRRLKQSAEIAPASEQVALTRMTDHLRSIRESVLEDPEDYRAARQFVNVYLPKIVQTVESYAKVASNTTDANADRLRGLGEQIRGFEPVFERIRTACTENDLAALEVEVAVLSNSLDRK